MSQISIPYTSSYDARVQELILSGQGKVLTDGWDDIPIVKNVSREKTAMPCQIPVKLCERLLSILTSEGQTVLDGFCGSGSMAEACKNMGRNFYGIDISKKYIAIAKERVKKIK